MYITGDFLIPQCFSINMGDRFFQNFTEKLITLYNFPDIVSSIYGVDDTCSTKQLNSNHKFMVSFLNPWRQKLNNSLLLASIETYSRNGVELNTIDIPAKSFYIKLI